MSTVIQKIRDLENLPRFSKHEQLVQGIVDAIDESIIAQGNKLPSVNTMVKELGYASKTIVKAYEELKERGLIESKKRHGYFLVNNNIEQTAKIALVMYAYQSFQKEFYNTFRASIGDNIQLDVFFHHNNIDVFETIVGNLIGQYSHYVIAPIHDPRTTFILNQIPPKKILIIDRYEKINSSVSHITQEFENSTFSILTQLLPAIQNFESVALYFQENSDFPVGILQGFKKFMKTNQISVEIYHSYVKGSMTKNKVYVTIGDGDLWGLLKDAKNMGYVIGKDIGVLSHNDDPVKEIICDGITTFSIDFAQMAREAGDFVLRREPIFKTMKMNLKRRNSL